MSASGIEISWGKQVFCHIQLNSSWRDPVGSIGMDLKFVWFDEKWSKSHCDQLIVEQSHIDSMNTHKFECNLNHWSMFLKYSLIEIGIECDRGLPTSSIIPGLNFDVIARTTSSLHLLLPSKNIQLRRVMRISERFLLVNSMISYFSWH